MISKRQFFLGLIAPLYWGDHRFIGRLFAQSDLEEPNQGIAQQPLTTSFDDIDRTEKTYIVPEGINFVKASRAIVPAVVHITNRSRVKSRSVGGPNYLVKEECVNLQAQVF